MADIDSKALVATYRQLIDEGIVEAVHEGVDPIEAHDKVRYDLMTRAGYEP